VSVPVGGRIKKTEADSSQWCPVRRYIEIQGIPCKHKKQLYSRKGDQALEDQKVFGLSILEDTQNPGCPER